ncbi:hypothetical protein Skr01_38250 [Sphaerisporangium krabiense]|nr:hypothetical protein Skr01_38250 [Sphaerisporangium krabiense]
MALRRLRAWSGLTYRQLSRRAADAGRTLPHNTLAAALGRDGLPREELLSAFAFACGLDDKQVTTWITARRRLAMALAEPAQAERGGTERTAGRDTPAAPNHLPRRVNDFTGREAEVVRLVRTADTGVVLIDAIDGMAGVGKTALAVHVAHELTATYPDGQLYVNLHAHTPGRAALEPADALGALLRMAGLPADAIPAGTEEAAALWRATLAERRMLIVLDDAADAGQVRPLLPGVGGARVFVTSRRRLTGLEDTTVISLDMLPATAARTLLTQIVGRARATAEPEALAEVAELCGRLPLALRIAGSRLRHRPAWSLAHLADRLRDQHQRLRELRAGDRSVEAAFALSYQQVPAAQQRMFRLLGLLPGDDIDTAGAAALAAQPLEEAAELLEALLDAHLVEQPTVGRFSLHDLLRAHARAMSAGHDPESERARALDRLHEHYHRTATGAVDVLLAPAADRPPTSGTVPTLFSEERAATWLRSERGNLIAHAVHAVDHDRPGHTLELSRLLFQYLHLYGYHRDSLLLHVHALRAARDLGEEQAETDVHITLAGIHYDLGDYASGIRYADDALTLARRRGDLASQDRALTLRSNCLSEDHPRQALDGLHEALAISRTTGDSARLAVHLHNIGVSFRDGGLLDQALLHFEEAMAVVPRTDDQNMRAYVLHNLADTYFLYGQLDLALTCQREALALVRRIVNRNLEMCVDHSLSKIYLRRGDLPRALTHAERALALSVETGERTMRIVTLVNHGVVRQRSGRYAEAYPQHLQALHLARATGYRLGQGIALNALGELCLRAGAPAQAITYHRHAGISLPVNLFEQARALTGIARALQATGRPRAARRHLHQAERVLRR